MPVQGELSFLILVLSSGILVRAQAQQGPVLTSSGELCFGQTVTLTCTHPDPFQDSAKYVPVAIAWAENGVALDFSVPATRQRFTPTRMSSTASTLFFAVTEDYHANRVINCSCFLTLNVGGREESDPPITIDVNAPPVIMSKPDSTSRLLQWRPSPSCSNYQYIFTLTWVRIGSGSTGTVSTEESRYDFTGMPGGKYTVSLKTRVTNFSNLSECVSARVQFNLIDCEAPQNTPAAAAGGTVSLTALAAVSAVEGLFMIISMVLAAILVGVLVRMRRRRREEGQERKRRDPGEANVPPVPMTTNPSYAQVQHSTEKKIPLYGNL